MSGFNIDDYVTVNERIDLFYEKYPDGRLCTVSVDYHEWHGAGILCIAHAYRSAEDTHPAVGTAWEPCPGKTQFTRDSEVQNAETAAWGRAIAALGIGTKRGIASRDEVQNRRADTPRPTAPPVQNGGNGARISARLAKLIESEAERNGVSTMRLLEIVSDHGADRLADLPAAEADKVRAELRGELV